MVNESSFRDRCGITRGGDDEAKVATIALGHWMAGPEDSKDVVGGTRFARFGSCSGMRYNVPGSVSVSSRRYSALQYAY